MHNPQLKKTTCNDCNRERKEYGNSYCIPCWNNGGEAEDKIRRDLIDNK